MLSLSACSLRSANIFFPTRVKTPFIAARTVSYHQHVYEHTRSRRIRFHFLLFSVGGCCGCGQDELGRLEDSLAKHVVAFEPTHERAASQQSLASLYPVKLEPGRPDWLEAFSEPLREEIPGLVGDIPYNETKLPKTRQRGMSSVKKPEDVKGMLVSARPWEGTRRSVRARRAAGPATSGLARFTRR